MAVNNRDFKVKHGLIVEGTNGTINGYDILTKNPADDQHIIDLIGGEATPLNTPDTVVKRDENGDFAAGIITAETRFSGDLTGNVTGTVSDISNHSTDDLVQGTNNLYFADYLATDAVAAELGTGIVYGSQGAGNVFHVDEMLIATRTYADDAADTAQENAESFAQQKATDAENNAKAHADTQAQNAQAAAEDYADSLAPNYDAAGTGAYQAGIVQGNLDTHVNSTSAHGVTEVVGTTESQTLSNKTLGSDLAAGGYKVSGLADPSANQDAATKSYVDTAVADLVGAAPELLDTLNELAEAIGDDADFIGTVNAAIGEKVAKAGDSMSGNLDFGGTSKVTSLAAPTNSGDAANKSYVDGEITGALSTAQGYANEAEENAIAHADALTTTDIAEGTALYFTDTRAKDAVAGALGDGIEYVNGAFDVQVGGGIEIGGGTGNEVVIDRLTVDTWYDENGAAATALQDAKDYADALDTDDVAEGTNNLYFTDSRAKDAAAALLTQATLTNITIDGTGAGLTITAENGVADSTTDDLDEGVDNLYFTDERAIDALQGTTPNFVAVELGEISKNVAGSTVVPVAGIATAYSWLKADYRSAEFLVKVAYGNHTEISKVLLTLDVNDNIAITEYGIVGTNTGSASSVSAAISGNDVQLQVTTVNNTSTVTVVGTLLA